MSHIQNEDEEEISLPPSRESAHGASRQAQEFAFASEFLPEWSRAGGRVPLQTDEY